MPRYPRKTSEKDTYHVMLRGNEKKRLFIDDEDRNRFIYILGKMKENNSYYLYAYCLMDNHVHLLVKEGEDSISRTMKRVGVTYAYYFNRKYVRVGHLFQDRFRSEAIEDDLYLLSASRYIHNNPVKANIVKTPGEYRWSSYNDYLVRNNTKMNLLDKEILLGLFSDEEESALRQFIEFTNMASEDVFIDCKKDNTIINDEDIRRIVLAILEKQGKKLEDLMNCGSRVERNALIREIKKHTGASVRQLSRILGLSKDIIFRA